MVIQQTQTPTESTTNTEGATALVAEGQLPEQRESALRSAAERMIFYVSLGK